MTDVENAIYAIEQCTCHVPDACRDCPYDAGHPYNECIEMLLKDVLELLKEQEPVELIDDGEDFVSIGDRMELTRRWKCGGCGNFVVYCETRPKIKFCHLCGREFKRG